MVLTVTRDSVIDDLIEACPQVVGLLIDEGLPCVVCGEPFWGTLGELAAQKGWDDTAIEQLVRKVQLVCEKN